MDINNLSYTPSEGGSLSTRLSEAERMIARLSERLDFCMTSLSDELLTKYDLAALKSALEESTSESVGMYANSSLTSEIFNDYEENTAEGEYSHAEGKNASANADFSHAGGKESIAEGIASFSSGIGTVSSGDGSAALGKYNAPSDNGEPYMLTVGNGTSPADRENAFSVKENGDTTVSGALHIGSHSTAGNTAGRITLTAKGSADNKTTIVTGTQESVTVQLPDKSGVLATLDDLKVEDEVTMPPPIIELNFDDWTIENTGTDPQFVPANVGTGGLRFTDNASDGSGCFEAKNYAEISIEKEMSGDFTIVCRFRMASGGINTSTGRRLFGYFDTLGYREDIESSGDGLGRLSLYTRSKEYKRSYYAYNVNRWYNAYMIRKGTTLTVSLQGEVLTGESRGNTVKRFFINSSVYPFNGEIDYFRVYNRVLTADEINQAFAGVDVRADYNELKNIPRINSVKLTGNKSALDLGFSPVALSGSYNDLEDAPLILPDLITAGQSDGLAVTVPYSSGRSQAVIEIWGEGFYDSTSISGLSADFSQAEQTLHDCTCTVQQGNIILNLSPSVRYRVTQKI